MSEFLNSALEVTLTRLVEKNVHVGQVIEAATQGAAGQGPARDGGRGRAGGAR